MVLPPSIIFSSSPRKRILNPPMHVYSYRYLPLGLILVLHWMLEMLMENNQLHWLRDRSETLNKKVKKMERCPLHSLPFLSVISLNWDQNGINNNSGILPSSSVPSFMESPSSNGNKTVYSKVAHGYRISLRLGESNSWMNGCLLSIYEGITQRR